MFFLFFFNDTATTEIYTLSLHDALPILPVSRELTPEVPLTRRESDVLDELLQGQSNRAIGKALFISEDTVKSHVKAILRKLGARDRAHAVSLVLSARNGGTCTCSTHALTAATPVVTDEPAEV